jgi:diguanylate cyclase (GGDEF)-like protein
LRYRGEKQKLIIFTSILLTVGFLATSLVSYFVSKAAIRGGIVENELPVTADNIYSEIQKDLIRPIFASSMMAGDTFVRDWILEGERDAGKITRYLNEIQVRHGVGTAFLVSEKTRLYYYGGGVLKRVSESEWRDVWYFRVRNMKEPYEINVDPDLANKDAMTIFINYRAFDYDGHFIAATGVSLTVDAVKKMINEYQERYHRSIFLVTRDGKIVVAAEGTNLVGKSLRDIEGLSALADRILADGSGSFIYTSRDGTKLLTARFIPELNWHLLVEKTENEALLGIRKTLALNLTICAAITILVILASTMTINRFQSRLEEMATTDKLTGLYNRQGFEVLIRQLRLEQKRSAKPYSVILFDIDDLKAINDSRGHIAGDGVIVEVAKRTKGRLRESDILCRWGGDEFLVILKDCNPGDAFAIAEAVRSSVAQADMVIEGDGVSVTVSLGVAGLGTDETTDAALGRADQALYAAKAQGRNRIVIEG